MRCSASWCRQGAEPLGVENLVHYVKMFLLTLPLTAATAQKTDAVRSAYNDRSWIQEEIPMSEVEEPLKSRIAALCPLKVCDDNVCIQTEPVSLVPDHHNSHWTDGDIVCGRTRQFSSSCASKD